MESCLGAGGLRMKRAVALGLAVVAVSSCVSPQVDMTYAEESDAAKPLPVALSVTQSRTVLHYEVTVTNTLPAELCFPAWYYSAAPVDLLHQQTAYQLVGDPIDEFSPTSTALAHLPPGEAVSLRGVLDLSEYRSFTQAGKAKGLTPRPGDAVTVRFRGIFDTCKSGVHSLRDAEQMAKLQEYTGPGAGEVLVVTSEASRPVRLP